MPYESFVRGQWWLITGRGTHDNQLCIIYPHGTFNRFLMVFHPETWGKHDWRICSLFKWGVKKPPTSSALQRWPLWWVSCLVFVVFFLDILKKGNHGNHGSCCYETLILRYTHKMIGSSMVSLPRSTDRRLVPLLPNQTPKLIRWGKSV